MSSQSWAPSAPFPKYPPPSRTTSTTTSRARQDPAQCKTRSRRAPLGLQIPDRFQSEEDEEEEDDPSADGVANAGMAVQSFYGIIAQAQGKSRFAEPLERTVEEGHQDEQALRKDDYTSGGPSRDMEGAGQSDKYGDSLATEPRRRRASSVGSMADMMTQSQILPQKAHPQTPNKFASSAHFQRGRLLASPRIESSEQADLTASSATVRKDTTSDRLTPHDHPHAPQSNMQHVLRDIFQFDEAEDLLLDLPCWYLQNGLLQGSAYITSKHVCFFAYVKKRGNVIHKSGHLSKQGKRDPRYSRYWFVLKGDVLSYFTSAAEPYFPSGTINLRQATSAEIVMEKGKEKRDGGALFTISTDQRVYRLKADSLTSAREWVKQLQRVIFRTHNDGDSVKIALPIANIVDIDSTPVIDFADTIRIRAVDDDETFSVEEYCFTFPQQGQKAMQTIVSIMEADQRGIKEKDGRRGRRSQSSRAEAYKAGGTHLSSRSKKMAQTYSEASASPTSQDRHARSPSEPSRRVLSASEYSHAGESISSFAASSTDRDEGDSVMSASQMLAEDTAFRAPTMRKTTPPRTVSDMTHMTTGTGSGVETPPSYTSGNDHPALIRETSTGEQSVSTGRSSPKPARGLTAPLQHAYSLAERVRSQGKRMSSYIGTSPKDYYTKFSGAIKGGKKHYSEVEGLTAEDRYDDPEEMLDNAESERRFHEHFALPESEKLLAVYYCWLFRVLPLYGKIYVGSSHLCFRSLLYGTRTKLNLPFKDVDNVQKEKGIRWSYPGMVVVIRGHEELFFDFADQGNRDDCVITILRQKEEIGVTQNSMIMTEDEKLEAQVAAAEHDLLLRARQGDSDDETDVDRASPAAEVSPILFDDATASILDIRPQKSMRITCLTIGSRGDVQPYVALCKGLLADGHRPQIATHAEFEPFVRSHGIDFVPVEGDPAELMRICVEYGMFTPSFLYEANSKFRGWLDGLLNSAYEACKGSDLLIESPSAMGGIHIAEALQIPYFRAFTMPWTRTRAYPHAFAVPNKKMGGQYNYMTYFLFDNMFWKVTAGQINRWRAKVLGLKPTSLEKLQPNKVPFLYNFSPFVVPAPLDFSDWVRVTGYWFLDEGNNWTPPSDLVRFIEKARRDKMKLVYIGFGSVVVSDSRQLTQQIVSAVQKADVRCILSKGWSDRFATHKDDGESLPECIFRINAAPHDWLFRQVDAVVHHGGAGTTGASLRAGVPTIIKPFFGDQFFFANRVEDLGVGMFLRRIATNALGKALWIATHDDRMKTKARVMGEQIRKEDGVGTAIKALYRDLEYAQTLIKKKDGNDGKVHKEAGRLKVENPTLGRPKKGAKSTNQRTSHADDENDDDENNDDEEDGGGDDAMEFEHDHEHDADEEEEESWTFVETESDVDVTASRSRGRGGTGTSTGTAAAGSATAGFFHSPLLSSLSSVTARHATTG